jgi:hypothetical protein
MTRSNRRTAIAVAAVFCGLLATGPARAQDSVDAARAYYASLAFPPPGFSWAPDEAVLAESGDLGFTTRSHETRSADPTGPVLQKLYLS